MIKHNLAIPTPFEKVIGDTLTMQVQSSKATYIYIYIPGPSNRSPLVAFGDLKVAGGDLLEGAGI